MSSTQTALTQVRRPEWRGGSVVGLEHVRLGKNNQDALAAHEANGFLAVVVTDGCGSGAYSEVGARLGATFLARALCEAAAEDGLSPVAAASAGEALLGWLEALLPGLGEPLTAMADHFLFGFLAVVTDGRRALVCGAGDGLFAIDGALTVVPPGAGNAPVYLTYRLVPRERLTEVMNPQVAVHFLGEAREVVLATDGAQPLVFEGVAVLNELAATAFEGASVHQLGRRLNVLAQRERRLLDDTTVAVVRLPGAAP